MWKSFRKSSVILCRFQLYWPFLRECNNQLGSDLYWKQCLMFNMFIIHKFKNCHQIVTLLLLTLKFGSHSAKYGAFRCSISHTFFYVNRYIFHLTITDIEDDTRYLYKIDKSYLHYIVVARGSNAFCIKGYFSQIFQKRSMLILSWIHTRTLSVFFQRWAMSCSFSIQTQSHRSARKCSCRAFSDNQ